MKGKTVTIIMLLVIFALGVAIIFFRADIFGYYVQLVTLVLVPMLVIMGGIAGQSIAKVIKGEAKIEDVQPVINNTTIEASKISGQEILNKIKEIQDLGDGR